MRLLTLASRTARIIAWIILGIFLLALGLLLTLYSQWGQEHIRHALLSALNKKPGVELCLDSFRLKFPLRLDIAGLAIVQDGDTAVKAESLNANVALTPLFAGRIHVDDLLLHDGKFQMGNADSAMMLAIKADTIELSPTIIHLSPLKIDIKKGAIAHGEVALASKPDTVAKPASTEASPLNILVGVLQLHDFTYKMAMLPTIDSLGVNVSQGTLQRGDIDLLKQTVKIHSFIGSGLNAAYIAPDSAQIANTPVVPATDPASSPWTITIDTISFDHSAGLYTTHGWHPQPGLDFAYIQASDMTIQVHNFYNQATTLSLPIQLTGIERCGVELDASGTFAMDSARMYFRDFEVTTPYTQLSADGMLGVGDMLTDPLLPLALNARGELGIPDLRLMFPASKPYLAGFSNKAAVDINADISGTAGIININPLAISINGCARLNAKGNIQDAFSAAGPSGNISLSGQIIDVKSILKSLALGSTLSVPPTSLSGNIDMHRGNIDATLQAHTLSGQLSLDAKYQQRQEGYNLKLGTVDFPIHAFMPEIGIRNASIALDAEGNGFDLANPKTNAEVHAHVVSLEYNGYDYRDITAEVALHDGDAHLSASVENSDVQLNINAEGNVSSEPYIWHAAVNGERIDLESLKLSVEPSVLSISLIADANVNPLTREYNATATLRDFNLSQQTGDIEISDVRTDFNSCDSVTAINLTNRDLLASISSPLGLDSIIARFDDFSVVLNSQIQQRHIWPDSIQQALPPFKAYLSAGADNFINDILRPSDMKIKSARMLAANEEAISMRTRILGFSSGTTRLDTIGLKLTQNAKKVQLTARVDNRPGTLDEFAHIRLDAVLNANKVALRASQQNIKDETGFDIGAITAFTDTTVTARVFPLNPTIGYKPWSVNLDNFITYTFPTHKIDANLHMKGDKSSLALYTTQSPDSVLNDIVLQITDIAISDWIAINPWAPPIAGDLSANMRLLWDGQESINGNGTVTLANFNYNKQRVGTFVSNLDVATNLSGMIKANANLMIDSQEAMKLSGYLNDSTATSPFDLDLSLIHFPLQIANPFFPDKMMALSGTLNGTMCVSGDTKQPLINGDINFEETSLRLKMTNTDYKFSDVHIPVKDNLIQFNDFGIYGANENPLHINGTVNLESLIDPRFDLTLNASNLMLVNTSKASRGADIYGKAYIDLAASAKGNMRFAMVDASLTLLSGTNVTYVMNDIASSLQAPTQTGMVKFVDFDDTSSLAQADSISNEGMLMNLDANLIIQNGTTICIDLPSAARDKVELQPQGQVTYTLNPMQPDGRMTGRINIDNGFARYTIPVIGQEKKFTFDAGSFIAFNGNILNPTLNVHATDEVKTNVTQEGQNSRLVNFDILLGITGTLANMNVKFDLSTIDDITIANELQSMSAEQRANQAMNLLLYNVYTGPGTKATGNLTANPLFSFLESQVNNWAAQNIKGVDLSFGIDQYNQTTNGSTTSAMSYSYQVSKTLFNDRFKIVVGGNYTTDASADDNLSENLINDISFEYYLNQQRTMLLKLFRHTGYESILEGEITQTGVGFVYKRKLNRLVQILPRFLRPRKYKTVQ